MDAVPEPTDALIEIARSLTDAFNADPPVWPASLTLQDDVDVGPTLRLSAAARALDGPLVLIPEPVKGEGSRSVTFRLASNSASWQLSISLEEAVDRIVACQLTAVDLNEQQHVAVLEP